MKSRINYFMKKDTRLVLDNLTKEIINNNLILIYYETLKKRKTIVVRYLKDKNRMLIYNEIKNYNLSIYKGFIDWANKKGIEWYGFGNEKEEV